MKEYYLDLSEFKPNPNSRFNCNLLLTVKSFNLQEIRERYLKSRKRGKTGSVKRRKPTQGGIVLLEIKEGKIANQEVVAKLIEPRGMDLKNNQLAISSEDKIFIFKPDTKTPNVIKDKWLSYIHTVKFNNKGNRVLVSSSGVDTVMEFDLNSNNKIWEWNAWENGFNQGTNPQTGKTHILTRTRKEAVRLEKEGENVIFINDPSKLKLPTALRAAFINSAEYDKDGNILITLFHEGELQKINKRSSELSIIMQGFNKPHGGMRIGESYLITDTAGGRVIQQTVGQKISYNFQYISGKDERLGELEWLQTSHFVKDKIVTVDSNRMNFTVIDAKDKELLQVPFNKNWAVQDFAVLKADFSKIIRNIKKNFKK